MNERNLGLALDEQNTVYQDSLTHNNGRASRPLALSDGGPLPDPVDVWTTLPEILQNAAQQGTGKQIYFPRPDGQELVWSYIDLLTAAQRICAGLRQQGLQPEDKVIIQLEKNDDLLPAFWGCILGGFIPMIMEVPSSYDSSNQAFDNLCQMSDLLDGPLILTEGGSYAAVKRVEEVAPTAGVRFAQIEHLRTYPPETDAHVSQPEDVAFLCFTSGSTGVPKSIQLTHRCIILRNAGMELLCGNRPDDVNLNWLPFDHIGSIAEHIRCLNLGCTMVYLHKEAVLSNPLYMLDIIDKYRVTHTWGPNFVYALILDALKAQSSAATWDLSCVKFLVSGGEPASYKMMKEFLERTAPFGFPATGLSPSYGMAELSAGITFYLPTEEATLSFFWIDNASFNAGTINMVEPDHPDASCIANLGRPIPGTLIRIVDETAQVVPEGTIGQVQIKGNPVALGYYKNPLLNKRVFLADGWFETEDLGFLSDGNLVLTGRAKEMLIINGVNYYSREIEDMVEEIAGVEVSYTAACAVKDGKSASEQLAIFFHPRLPDNVPSGEAKHEANRAALQALIQKIRQTVVSRIHLNPAYIIPLPKAAIPKTPIGKIKRTELSQRFLEGEFAAFALETDRTRTPPRNPLEATIAQTWQDVLKLEMGVHDNFFELGGDSIKAVMAMNQLQEQMDGILHPVSIFDAPTISELAEYFKENYPRLFKASGEASSITVAQPLDEAQIAYMQRYLRQSLGAQSVTTDQAGPKNKQTVFILSPARSGSTLLRAILGGSPQLFSPPELYLLGFNTLQARRELFSGRLDFVREGVMRAIMALKACSHEKADEIMSAFEAQDMSVKSFYALLQSWLGDRVLVDKTPSYAFNPAVLQRTEAEFDQTRYIHLVRHPAAMIHSFEEARVDLAVNVHGDETGEVALSTRQKGELWWLISHQNILAFLEIIPADRQYVVKFEELVTAPENTIRQLCDFLAIDFNPAMLEPQQDKAQRMTDGTHHLAKLAGDPKFHTHQGITASAADRWQVAYQADFLSEATWQIAEAFGYTRESTSAVDTKRQVPTKRLSLADFQIEADLANRLQPFPLTDIQQAYWAGRNQAFELGGRSVHAYTEVDGGDLDVERFTWAWQRMIERHEMLRTVILPDGRQQILPEIPIYNIEVQDFSALLPDEQEAALLAVRDRMSHQVLSCDEWPLFEIRVSRLAQNRYRIHFSFDAILFDARSKYILFSEFSQFYQQPTLALNPLDLSFRDYVLQEVSIKRSPLFDQARDYWLAQMPTLPGTPELSLALNPATLKQPAFIQKNYTFKKEAWGRLKALAAQAQITPSCLFLTVFSDVIRVWNKLDTFTINITAYNRLPLHAEVNDIIGDFTSVILMEIDPPEAYTFVERVRRLQKRLLNNLQHNLFSGVQLMREMTRSQEHKPGAQMPVVFTSVLGDEIQDTDRKPMDWLGDVIYNVTQTPQIWFDHIVFEEGGELLCRWNIVEKLFPAGLMDDLFGSYIAYLTRLTTEEDAWHEVWPETAGQLVPAHQLEQRRTVNATLAPIGDDLLHTPFVTQAKLRPTHLAVVSAERTLTYQELYERSNQVGHRLRKMGVQPNQLVAVVMEKGWEQVVAVMGILASGAAYLPIDPSLPQERLHYLLTYGEVQIILTQSALQSLLDWPQGMQCLCVDDDTLASESTNALEVWQTAKDLAYVIFTSGSTGLPKGVMIDHRGALNTIVDINNRFNISAADRVLALSALTFDLSVYDIFGLLAIGGTIVMPRQSDVRNPAQWAKLVSDHQVTIWNTVPAFMDLLMDYAVDRADIKLASLKLVMMSGDWIPLPLPQKIKQQLDDPCVMSLGGATEASIWSITYPIETIDPAWKSIPYGKPMQNQTFHVLNKALEPCPTWVPGMLYIGGIGLAKGYWRDREKTEQSFIIHPRTGERLYRTGDLGRYLPDGNIEFLGREDFQVKIQGFRVELGEIEAALMQHSAVKSVVVDARGELHAEKQLVAYVVLAVAIPDLSATMQTFLKQKLPAYMVPAVYVPLSQLPLTPNGKIDRKSLPNPTEVSITPLKVGQGPASASVASDVLTTISTVVEAILETELLAPDDDLFNFGATSIHMMRIANQLEKTLGFRPAIDEFYANPTILGVIEAYEAATGTQGKDPSEPASDVLAVPQSTLEQFDFIGDPSERQHFKEQQLGIRTLSTPAVPLLISDEDQWQTLYEQRRTQRRFLPKPVSLADFSRFFACLRQIKLADEPKYLYGSAGGLYPVQTYLYVKSNRIESLAGGIYYYHPLEHQLYLIANEPELDPQIYSLHINRPIFAEAAFGIFLIAQLGAIVPMYREHSLHFATLEAGLITQLLETQAPNANIGLCQTGALDFDRVRHLFELDETHVLVHALLGGIPDKSAADRWSAANEVYHNTDDAQREEEDF